MVDEGCAFEELISFHGGLGGPQTRPFILHPATLALPEQPILGAEAVHARALRLAHRPAGPAGAPAGTSRWSSRRRDDHPRRPRPSRRRPRAASRSRVSPQSVAKMLAVLGLIVLVIGRARGAAVDRALDRVRARARPAGQRARAPRLGPRQGRRSRCSARSAWRCSSSSSGRPRRCGTRSPRSSRTSRPTSTSCRRRRSSRSSTQNTEAVEKLKEVAADAARTSRRAADEPARAPLGGAIGSVFSLVTLAFLTLFGLIVKPQLTRSALDLMEPGVADRVDKHRSTTSAARSRSRWSATSSSR